MNTVKMVLVIIGICIFGSVVLAGSGGQYVLEWSTIDGGGGVSSGGQYSLRGTIGQHDAGYLGGGQFDIDGGFQVGGALCFVNFVDFAKFAEYWLMSGSNLSADLYPDGTIDNNDLSELTHWWLSPCPYDWPLK